MQPFIKFLIAGLVFVIIGILNIIKGIKMKSRCTESTSATIVDIEVEHDISDDDTPNQYRYTPIYEFSANGTTVRKNGGIYTNNKRKYHVGDTTGIKFNPSDPTEFLVNGKNTGKAVGIPLLIFGIVIIIIAFTQM